MASDLPRRLGVVAVGIPAVVGLLWVGGWILAVPVAVLAGLGAVEVFDLARPRGVRPFRTTGAVAAAGLVLAAAAGGSYGAAAPGLLGVLLGLFGFCLILILRERPQDDAPLPALAVTVAGTCYAGVPLAFVPLLHAVPAESGWGGAGVVPAAAGLVAVALPLTAAWVGDSVAYFAGSAWGRKGPKLAPTISPNKSWIGTLAGLAGSAVGAVIWGMVAREVLPAAPIPTAMFLAMIGAALGVAAQAGDLAESLLKREAGVKDSGTIFPGHGGVLDRIDALVLSLPLAYAALRLFELLP